jgi:hypothetical protein
MQIRTCVANGEDVIGFRAPQKNCGKYCRNGEKERREKKKDTFP